MREGGSGESERNIEICEVGDRTGVRVARDVGRGQGRGRE